MQCIKTTSIAPVVEQLATAINQALQKGQRVLWLVSGGSAIAIAVATAQEIQGNTHNLTIGLADERYGAIGHADSNWQQLLDAGFAVKDAVLLPVLAGEDFAQTAEHYRAALVKAWTASQFTVGLLGIGNDGHTAGLLPHSVALQETESLIASYQAPDFERITITASAMLRLSLTVVYAAGATKHQTLATLKQDVPIEQQPAQLLKTLRNCYLYNDVVEGTL